MKSLAGEFVYGYDATNPLLLTKMTGPVHQVETTYEPHRNLITGVTNTVAASILLGGPVPTGVPPVVSRTTNSPNPAPAAGPGLRTKGQASRTISSYAYSNDLLGRRETISQGGEAFGMLKLGENKVDVAYNDRSEVTGAVYRAANEARQSFDYAYDTIGNRNRSVSELGGQKSEVRYEANALNQYQKISEGQRAAAISHDLDGNLLEDARNTYTWNSENRLVTVESKDSNTKVTYTYDYQGRRTTKKTFIRSNKTENFKQKATNSYIYDGWNLLSEIEAPGSEAENSELKTETFTWGRDLSGSLQGAGGVGGLLAISKSTENSPLKTENFYPAYDANGNIGQLVDAAGELKAAYSYDPFGGVTESVGEEAANNPWRFSTKEVEEATGWSYYGFRYCVPETGRWAGRDPIGEMGGVNLYGFVGNKPTGEVDRLGLSYFDDYLAKCDCTDENIKKGKEDLKKAYRKVRADLRSSGQSSEDGDSCRQCSENILSHPDFEVPDCWACTAEHRYADSYGRRWRNQFRGTFYGSHSIVRCHGYNADGDAVDNIEFDYFFKPDSDDPLSDDELDDFLEKWPDNPELEYLRGFGLDQTIHHPY